MQSIAQIGTTSRTVSQLADEINAHHNAAERAAKTAIEHALEAGRLLTEAKAQIGHGGWGDWLAENFAGSDRVARRYMALHAKRDQIPADENGRARPISIREAVRAIAPPAKRDETELKTEHESESSIPIPDPGEMVYGFYATHNGEEYAITVVPHDVPGYVLVYAFEIAQTGGIIAGTKRGIANAHAGLLLTRMILNISLDHVDWDRGDADQGYADSLRAALTGGAE